MKANTGEAGADVKESGSIQVPATWKVRDSHLKACLRISGILASLYRGTWEEGNEGIPGDVQFLSSALEWVQCHVLHASL